MKHRQDIQRTIDQGVEIIQKCVAMTNHRLQTGVYAIEDVNHTADKISKTLERISGIGAIQDGASLNNSLQTWICNPVFTQHPFNLFRNSQFLKLQQEIIEQIQWDTTKILINIGGRQSGKTAAAAFQFVHALAHRFRKRLESGELWEGWLDYAGRAEYEPFIDALIIAPKDALTRKTSEYFRKILTLADALSLIDTEISTKKGGIWLHGGVRIQICTGSNENNIMGKALDVVLVDELARLNELIYEQTIRPALLTKDGLLIAATTILKGEHWFIDLIKSGLDKDSELWEKNQTNYDASKSERPKIITYFHHTKNNTFIKNIDDTLDYMKRTMSKYIYEQEIEGIWFLQEDAVFVEFRQEHVHNRTDELVHNILSSAEFVAIGLDIGFSSAKEHIGSTALTCVAFSRYSQDVEDCDYVVLASAASNQIPFLNDYWSELIRKWSQNYNVKYLFYDNAKQLIIDSFLTSYMKKQTCEWITASKTLMPGIEHMKRLFHLGKIDILDGEGNTGNDSLVNDLVNYKWKKDTLHRPGLEPSAAYSDRPDALRYCIVTPYFRQLGVAQ